VFRPDRVSDHAAAFNVYTFDDLFAIALPVIR
jgi:hypothetical protein